MSYYNVIAFNSTARRWVSKIGHFYRPRPGVTLILNQLYPTALGEAGLKNRNSGLVYIAAND